MSFVVLFCYVIFFQFYTYKDKMKEIVDARFYGRLEWKGSNDTKDLQDGSIYMKNVTFDDAGTYMCIFNRVLMYPIYQYKTNTSKSFVLNVVPQSKSRRKPVPLIVQNYSSFRSDCSFKHVESKGTPMSSETSMSPPIFNSSVYKIISCLPG